MSLDADLAALVEAAVARQLEPFRAELKELLGRGPVDRDGYVPLAAAARALGVSSKTIGRMLSEGAPSIGAGRRRRVNVRELATWMTRRGSPNDIERRADELLARGRRGAR